MRRITNKEVCNNKSFVRVDEGTEMDSLRKCVWKDEYQYCITPVNGSKRFKSLCEERSNTSPLKCNAPMNDPNNFYAKYSPFPDCKSGLHRGRYLLKNPNATQHDESKCEYKGCMDPRDKTIKILQCKGGVN